MAKATRAKAKSKSKSKPKAKAKPKAKVKSKAKAKAKAKVGKAKSVVRSKATPRAKAVAPLVRLVREESTSEARVANESPGMAPFAITETSPGNFSLLLTQFEPASAVFDAAGVEGGGYAWEGIAAHVAEVVLPELAGRFGLDPEASMFSAYGEDRAALERLGVELARVFHDGTALAAMIQTIGPNNFED